MPDVRRAYDEAAGEMILAYSDTHLCYCPECAHRLGYDDPSEWGPNWLPFIPITRLDGISEKYCDSCERILPSE